MRLPCIDSLTAVTVTPGTAAPLSSLVFPLIAPVVELTVWAHALVMLTSATNTPTATTFPRLMVPPPSQDKLVSPLNSLVSLFNDHQNPGFSPGINESVNA